MIFFILSFNLMMLSLFNFNLTMMFMIKKLTYLFEWTIYMKNFLMIKFILYIDWMSLIFITTIFIISSMVILYSMEYMKNDLNINRFMMLIMIFISSMIMLIISMNLLTILLGWDGLGLSSYCLVIYYQNKKSYNSGMITILMNRFGDIMILISISLLMMNNSWNFLFMNKINYLMMMMIFLAAITKSAQIPFSTWLPLAMSAPTPISALVHSSTLVTAGIYLLIRFNHLIKMELLFLIMMISMFTMLFSGISANFEFDLKKIIALSTLSQLGLMLFILSFKLNMLCFFHLISHAMFKSLMFLCSGIMIHNMFNNQDIRFISLNNMNMPFNNMTFMIASLSLCGMPFLTGFYSKDFIIEMFNMIYNNSLIYMIMYISMGLTISYSTRLIFFLNLKNTKIMNNIKINFFNKMNYSIIILIFLTILFGSMMNWLIFNSLNFIYLNFKMKTMIFIFLFMGIILGMIITKINFLFNNKFIFLFKMFNLMFFLPLNFNKNKINFFKLNLKKLIIQDYGWNEYLLFKKIIYILNLNNFMFMKKLNTFSILFMIFMFMFMIMMMIY
uniref:NADH-ubiquinone oxidoreductase chain 5 n=1 Tax=Choeras grammatitergitus TaxID=1911502 RepID=A0A6F8A7P2_9HYME|nr:NADH dehydrogenase subunit 5 [Choeras grammatitergitus]